MPRLVECVPNFSEGRRREVVEELVRTVAAVPGVTLLDSEMDADHNRSVLTFAGEPEPVVEAAFAAVKRAAELIDLTRHHGEHPRMGAADVVPFVPVEGVSLDDCVRLARLTGRRIGEELGIPVFLYEAAATRPERVSLADVRRGEFEGLRELIGRDPARRPDFGPELIHPTAGAVAVGARRFLVAFNANLNTPDVRVAKAIAATIREQSGGLKHVRALGFSIEGGRRAQVSMNLVHTEATPIHRVLALVRAEAARWGAAVQGCEVVGLVPEFALLDAAEHALQLENFRRDQVLELRLRQPPTSEAVTLGGLLDQRGAGGQPGRHGGRADGGQEEVRRQRGGDERGVAQGRGRASRPDGPGAPGQRRLRRGGAGAPHAADHPGRERGPGAGAGARRPRGQPGAPAHRGGLSRGPVAGRRDRPAR